MQKIKTVFFGTQEFATHILQGLINSPLIEVALVITQADQPVGRKQILTAPPTKLLAEKNNIPVLQPETLKGFEFPFTDFDLSVVAQYGRIIPERLLTVPKYKTLNVHTSLLPKYRGASPIQFALLSGETKTGVTIMQMDKGMDTGPILLQKTIDIDPTDTYTELDKKLAILGIESLLETISGYIDGTILPQTQNDAEATYTKILTRDDGRIDWNRTASEIYNQYRGLTPWPGIWTMLDGKRLKLLDIAFTDVSMPQAQIQVKQGHVYVGTAHGSLEILSLQLEGKPIMDAKTFANGYQSLDGSVLI
jgi:methionyl-tRNA formyltransferase